MRSILLSLIILPHFASAQINRSAKEFASERIGEYIKTKLFKDKAYHSLSFSEIKSAREKENVSEIEWSLVHEFEITENKSAFGKKKEETKRYKFVFYMDKRMRVLRADGYYFN